MKIAYPPVLRIHSLFALLATGCVVNNTVYVVADGGNSASSMDGAGTPGSEAKDASAASDAPSSLPDAAVSGFDATVGTDASSPASDASAPDAQSVASHDAASPPDTGATTPDAAQAGIDAGQQVCPGGGNTTISGRVYDPAMQNPVYNATVFVPSSSTLTALPKGVPTGADSCSCISLFPDPELTSTVTATDGTFKLENVPAGSNVPLVIQIGKWRRLFHVNVVSCNDNPQADKSLAFLGAIPVGDTNDSLPDIAVSTGGADTLECLLTRMGIASSEYVPGASTSGHVHIFSGGSDGTSGTGGGLAESTPMTGAPQSYQALWDTQADLMNYDVVMLSCEGGETFNAQPQVMEEYLNAGGRALGSHFHYAWFAGPRGGSGGGTPDPAPPADWGTNLASWFPEGTPSPGGAATVAQSSAEGIAFDQWLTDAGALGIEGAGAGLLEVFQEKGTVGATNKAEARLTDGTYTDLMTFSTPVSAPTQTDGGAPLYCGRAAFGDVHVGGDTDFVQDSKAAPPGNCAAHNLSPQESALEFMLFELSACTLP